MQKCQLILLRLPLLPIHAVAEFMLLCVSILLVPFIEVLTRAIGLAEKLPDMCWYRGGQYHDLKKRVNRKIQKRLKEKRKNQPKAG